jgi:AsmA family/AsmA-like C-terminal region
MTSESEETGFARPGWKVWLAVGLVLLLVAGVALPPLININRYQRKITDSVSRSLGRPVHMSDVKLHLLPRPGFEISNFIVDEDPAFGVEPTLRSASVMAYVRLWSLWRGRLEVARISLDEPSLNLVRNGQNRWNVSTVLLQASRLSNAPTGQVHAGGAPRFPYIEASSARINFKFGNEKKPFSFLNADVSMWLANADEWELRFVGQPVRTDLDLDLSDTGELRVNGTLHRAAELGRMPVRLSAEWSHAPLGQMSRLVLGSDTGWRGDLDVTSEVTGDLQNMLIKTRMRVDGMHRVEFTPMEPINLDTRCEGNLHRTARVLEGVTCLSPVGDGQLLLRGGIANLDAPRPDLTLEVKRVTASRALDALRLVRNGFAPSVQATGTMDGQFAYHGNSKALPVEGQVTVNALSVSAPGFEKALVFPVLHFVAEAPPALPAKPKGRTKMAAVRTTQASTKHLVLQPFTLGMGGTTPLTVGGVFDRNGFQVRLNGGSGIGRLIVMGKNFGLLAAPASRLEAQGTADLDLTVRGPWVLPVANEENPVAAAATEGTLKLHNAVVDPGFLPEPLEIVLAQANLTDSGVNWNPVSASFHHVPIDGSLSYSIPCGGEEPCARHFDVRLTSIDAGALQGALLGAGEHGELLNEILAKVDRHPQAWPVLTGTIRAELFTLGGLALHGATATIRVDGNKLSIVALDAQALQGTLHASGTLDAGGGTPRYTLDAALSKANPVEVAALFHETWGAGTVNATTHLELAGYGRDQLASSAHGTFHWDWSKGSLPLSASSPLARFDRWTATGTLADGTLALEHSVLTHGAQTMPLTGTVTFDRAFELKSAPPARPLTLSGSLRAEKPQSAALPAKVIVAAARK